MNISWLSKRIKFYIICKATGITTLLPGVKSYALGKTDELPDTGTRANGKTTAVVLRTLMGCTSTTSPIEIYLSLCKDPDFYIYVHFHNWTIYDFCTKLTQYLNYCTCHLFCSAPAIPRYKPSDIMASPHELKRR